MQRPVPGPRTARPPAPPGRDTDRPAAGADAPAAAGGAVALVGLLAALGYVVLVPAALTASAVVAVRPVVTDAFTPAARAPTARST
ncbi:hypothetical protein NKG94_18335 [Micromonospora sp. M12]